MSWSRDYLVFSLGYTIGAATALLGFWHEGLSRVGVDTDGADASPSTELGGDDGRRATEIVDELSQRTNILAVRLDFVDERIDALRYEIAASRSALDHLHLRLDLARERLQYAALILDSLEGDTDTEANDGGADEGADSAHPNREGSGDHPPRDMNDFREVVIVHGAQSLTRAPAIGKEPAAVSP